MQGPVEAAKAAFVEKVSDAVCQSGSDADADVVQAWLDAGAKVEWLAGATRDNGLPLPCVAAYFGQLKVLKALAARGKGAKLPLDGLSSSDMTGLAMTIVREGAGYRQFVCAWSAEAAGLLLDMGAGLETKVLCKASKLEAPKLELTPLQVAAKYAKPDVCELLVKRGAKKDGAVSAAVQSWMDKGQGSGSMVPNSLQIPETISKLVALGCPVTLDDFKQLLYKETMHPSQASLTDTVRRRGGGSGARLACEFCARGLCGRRRASTPHGRQRARVLAAPVCRLRAHLRASQVFVDMAKALPPASKAAALEALLKAIAESKADGACNVKPHILLPARAALGWTGADPPEEALDAAATAYMQFAMSAILMKAYGQAGTDQYKSVDATATAKRKALLSVAAGIKAGAGGAKAAMPQAAILAVGLTGDAALVSAVKNGFNLSSGLKEADMQANMLGAATAKGSTPLHVATSKALKLWADVADATKEARAKFPEPFRGKGSEAEEYKASKASLQSATAEAKKASELIALLLAAGADRDAKDGDGKTAWDCVKASGDKAGALAAFFLGLA